MKCSTTTSYNGVKNGASKLLEDFFFHKKKKEITFTDFAQEFITILSYSVVFKLEEIEIGLHAQHGKM